MNWIVITAIIFLVFFLFKPGRKVILIGLGLVYVPLQHLFMWLQKINLSLKDKDPLMYYLSCVFIYPLYAIIIPFSKFYETITDSLK